MGRCVEVPALCLGIEALPPAADPVADRGNDSQTLLAWLNERGTEAVIAPRKYCEIQYEYDNAIYSQLNVIKRMFCRLKDWRRLASRFDHGIKNSVGVVALAAAIIWWLCYLTLIQDGASCSRTPL